MLAILLYKCGDVVKVKIYKTTEELLKNDTLNRNELVYQIFQIISGDAIRVKNMEKFGV